MRSVLKKNILVVEDDPDIQQLVTFNLVKTGLHVTCADNGEEALEALEREQVDGIVLDLMLPGMDGLALCRRLRRHEHTGKIPIIILTARGEEDDIVAGLEAGADDYVTKPFSPRVLVARVQNALRRRGESDRPGAAPPREPGETVTVHGLTIHPGRHEVLADGMPIRMTATEFTILLLLAGKPGWVFTRQQIIDHSRGLEYLITPRAVDVQIFGLRKKLGSLGHLIETVRGIGYRMKE